jgi:hypothetical protein
MKIIAPSLEAINYQANSKLFSELVDFINDLRKLGEVYDYRRVGMTNSLANAIKSGPYLKQFSDIILEHTGMRVFLGSLTVDYGGIRVQTFIPSTAAAVGNSSPIRTPHNRGVFDILLAYEKDKENEDVPDVPYRVTGDIRHMEFTLDRKEGKVNFAQYSPVLGYISFPIADAFGGVHLHRTANATLTPEELAATILHEIGHVWYGLEVVTLSRTIDYSLKDAIEAFAAPTLEKRKTIIAAKKNFDSFTQGELDQLASCEDFKDAAVLIATHYASKTASELGHPVMDYRSAEIAADVFASRHGAGKHLLKALAKIDYNVGNRRALQFTMLVGSLTHILVGTAFSLGLYLPLYALYTIFAVTDPRIGGDLTYGSSRKRLERLRNDCNAIAKDRSISPEVLKDINETAELADTLIKATAGNYVSLKYALKWALSPKFRNSLKYEDFIQQMQAMANNDLFRMAADLKHKAQEGRS